MNEPFEVDGIKYDFRDATCESLERRILHDLGFLGNGFFSIKDDNNTAAGRLNHEHPEWARRMVRDQLVNTGALDNRELWALMDKEDIKP